MFLIGRMLATARKLKRRNKEEYMTIINELPMNIISVPQGWYIAHAIRADLNFSTGLPATMDKVFDIGNRLEVIKEHFGITPGEVLQLGNLYNLIVKESSYDSPDREALADALIELRDNLEGDGAKKLAMPRICTGRNGLPWKDVLEMIDEAFDGMDILILICVQ